MKKSVLCLLAACLMVSLLLAACVKAPTPAPAPAPAPTGPPASEAKWQWPSTFRIASHAIGSSSQPSTTAWAMVMENMTGMKVSVIPEDSVPLKARWLQGGDVNLHVETLTEIGGELMGANAGYATREGGPFQLRAVWIAYTTGLAFYSRGDSNIKSVRDIKKGTRFATITTIPALTQTVKAMVAWAGLKDEDVVYVPFASLPAMVQAIPDGKADVGQCAAGAAAVFEAAAGPHGLHFIELDPKKDPEGATKFLQIKPTFTFGPCPAGPPGAVGVMMGVSAFMMWAKEGNDEQMYHMAQWLDENYNAYKDKQELCKFMSRDQFRQILDYTFLPVHEGTIKYLKEKGVWTPADDARQKENVDLVTKYVDAYKAAIAEADAKKITIDYQNPQWIELWNNIKKGLPVFRVRL